MPITITLPLDVPEVRVLASRVLEDGTLLIEVESTLRTAQCHCCGREIDRFHGFDRPIRLRHRPAFGREVLIEIRPQRYRCPHCAGGPTTTQGCAWYDPNRPHTTAFEQEVLKRLVHSTVADVSRQLNLGVKAVEGIMDHRLAPAVDWTAFAALETLGIDEVALGKGHGQYVAVIWARDARGHTHVLAVLPDPVAGHRARLFGDDPGALENHDTAGLYRPVGRLRRRGDRRPAQRPDCGGSFSRGGAVPRGGGRSPETGMRSDQCGAASGSGPAHGETAAVGAPGMAVADPDRAGATGRTVRADADLGQCLYPAHHANGDL